MELSNEEREDIASLQYRMEEEGFEYCFEGYSDWREIKDKKFQNLRKNYLDAKNELKNYVDGMLE